jgi:two-component system, response regulator
MELAKPIVLLIENDEADVFLFRRAMSQLDFKGTIRVVDSVHHARDYLEGRGEYSDRRYYPVPDLIVSDMNLPGAFGNVFLEWLRKDERFVALPFVFLSGTFLPPDKAWAEKLGAEGFFHKTGDIEVMKERVQKMLKFLPPQSPPA